MPNVESPNFINPEEGDFNTFGELPPDSVEALPDQTITIGGLFLDLIGRSPVQVPNLDVLPYDQATSKGSNFGRFCTLTVGVAHEEDPKAHKPTPHRHIILKGLTLEQLLEMTKDPKSGRNAGTIRVGETLLQVIGPLHGLIRGDQGDSSVSVAEPVGVTVNVRRGTDIRMGDGVTLIPASNL